MNFCATDIAWINDRWEKVNNKLLEVSVRSREKLPYYSENGVHVSKHEQPDWWTNGFWGGMMWLMYNATGNEEYKITAKRCEQLLSGAFGNISALHHDVGFMWHITSGARCRLMGDKDAENTELFMASLLSSRFVLGGNFIRAWNTEKSENLTIIDTLMNVPMLYFASELVGDDRYKRIAMAHVDMVMRDHVREDGSTVHIVEHDRETGKKIREVAGQGYADNSCWSRGLSWAVYGFALSYIHTGKKEYLDTAVKCADYFISECGKTGYVPLLDFKAPKEPVYYDSTAGVITACGLIEISKILSDSKYFTAAMRVLKETDEKCCDYTESTDSIVGMGSVRYPHKENNAVHIPIIYGDFYFVEALCKLLGKDFLIW